MDTRTPTANGTWKRLGVRLSYDEALRLAKGRLIAVIVAKYSGAPDKVWVIPETETEYNEAMAKGYEVYSVKPGVHRPRRK
ncbi:MAG TPA: hypothetical protein VJ841_04440 [Candidatus Saccharimonadales bacterium]|nr:hypothetical protein [Candidatus Saccharimonadales bacterium]